MCSRLGAGKEDIARAIGVNVDTVYNWMERHDTFFLAIKRGMEIWDTEGVVKALVSRAKGYEYKEVETEEVVVKLPGEQGGNGGDASGLQRTRFNGNGGGANHMISKGSKTMYAPGLKITTRIKHVLPNPQCMFFYLCNRAPDEWKHMMQHVKLEGNLQGSFQTKNQTVDWTKLAEQLGVEGLRQLRDLLQPIQLEAKSTRTGS